MALALNSIPYFESGIPAHTAPAVVLTKTLINTPNVVAVNSPTPAIVATKVAIGAPSLTKGTEVFGTVVVTRALIATPTVKINARVSRPIVVTRALISSPLVLTTSATMFSPPTRKRKAFAPGDRWLSRLHWDEGQTVLKKNGFYTLKSNPSDQEIETADAVYLGGRSYQVSVAEATALYQAGYGAYLS
jgi:hypothetical protein